NVLEVISDHKISVETSPGLGLLSHYGPEVLAQNDYYPFGMLLPNRHEDGDEYRYGFQGQEKDNEVYDSDGSSVNYKYRMYNSRVARFFKVDPLAHQFPWNSQYAFSENRVIDGVELEGLEVSLVRNHGRDRVLYAFSRTFTDPDNVISLIGHGKPFVMVDKVGDERYIRKTDIDEHFEPILKRHKNYDVWKQQEDRTIVIYNCRTGRTVESNRTEGVVLKPIAQEISIAMPEVRVVAPDGRVKYKNGGEDIFGSVEKTHTDIDGDYDEGYDQYNTEIDDNRPSYWNVFEGGILVAQYSGDWKPHYSGHDKEAYDAEHLVYDINDSSTKPHGSFSEYYPESTAPSQEAPLVVDGKVVKEAGVLDISIDGDTLQNSIGGDTIRVNNDNNNESSSAGSGQ
ncbi:MAG: hypothetical protein MK105_02275, partial [Crocinitomicaceae bacterium]|nr:hypothetical protein [Crocinitomicaceae bacterium]